MADSTRPHYRIRRMKPEDVPGVLEIWALNDLHEGTGTIQSFMAQDPDGFVVAVEVEDDHREEQSSGAVQVLVTDDDDDDLESSSSTRMHPLFEKCRHNASKLTESMSARVTRL